jgi:hypothetical protein
VVEEEEEAEILIGEMTTLLLVVEGEVHQLQVQGLKPKLMGGQKFVPPKDVENQLQNGRHLHPLPKQAEENQVTGLVPVVEVEEEEMKLLKEIVMESRRTPLLH